jgi:hypothetical protein
MKITAQDNSQAISSGSVSKGLLRPLAKLAAGSMLLSLAATAAPAAKISAAAVPFENPGMEEGGSSPAGWSKGASVPGVELIWDKSTAHSGKASLALKKTTQAYFPIAQWHQQISIEPTAKARKLKVRCWVKAEQVTKAIIDVQYETSQRGGHSWAAYIGKKQQTDPVANHDWKLYEGTVQLPANTSSIAVGFQIYGPGHVWFDDLEAAWND